MPSIVEFSTKSNNEVDPPSTPNVEGCGLNLPLGDCPARRVGCRNHYEMLRFMMPPWSVREYIRHTMGNDSEARAWLARLDAVLPGQRNARGDWR